MSRGDLHPLVDPDSPCRPQGEFLVAFAGKFLRTLTSSGSLEFFKSIPLVSHGSKQP